jgi:hypothetical protein
MFLTLLQLYNSSPGPKNKFLEVAGANPILIIIFWSFPNYLHINAGKNRLKDMTVTFQISSSS